MSERHLYRLYAGDYDDPECLHFEHEEERSFEQFRAAVASAAAQVVREAAETGLDTRPVLTCTGPEGPSLLEIVRQERFFELMSEEGFEELTFDAEVLEPPSRIWEEKPNTLSRQIAARLHDVCVESRMRDCGDGVEIEEWVLAIDKENPLPGEEGNDEQD